MEPRTILNMLKSDNLILHRTFGIIGFTYPVISFWMASNYVIDKATAAWLIKPLFTFGRSLSYLFPLFPEWMIGIQFWLLPFIGGLVGWLLGYGLSYFVAPNKTKAVSRIVVIGFLLFIGISNWYFWDGFGTVSHSFKVDGYKIDITSIEKPYKKNEIMILAYVDGQKVSNLSYNANMEILKDGNRYLPKERDLFGTFFPLIEPPFTLKIVSMTVYNPGPIVIPINKEIRVKALGEDFLRE